LRDPAPGVRKAAAMGLGRDPRPQHAPALLDALRRERMVTPRLALAAAWARCGGAPEEALTLALVPAQLSLRTARGGREPESAAGFGPDSLSRELLRLLDPDWIGRPPPWGAPPPVAALRARLLDELGRDAQSGEGRQALEDLGALGHNDDLPLLHDAQHSAGRRGSNSVIIAMGLHGDPRLAPLLIQQLERVDVDPGRGFAWRRLSAVALGRLGLPTLGPTLLKALEVEALDFEGRPGAGLGVQFPVRVHLLWALGELGDLGAAPTLIGYLGNLHGSALGGFHLPAMGALWKLGPAVAPALERLAAGAVEEPGVNAVGVLEALGAWDSLTRVAQRDGLVGQAAREALSERRAPLVE
ncbi:hypothetical protein L6R49_26760, partial [Myxococcota bacterium]|nr:hypothetical protein [Myxococcota bacterium]